MHVHPPRRPELPESEIDGSLRRFFKMDEPPEDVAAMAARYEALDIVGVLLTIDSETTTGDKPDGNDYTAEIVKAYPDRFIGFASVDPHKGSGAVTELERALARKPRCVRAAAECGLRCPVRLTAVAAGQRRVA